MEIVEHLDYVILGKLGIICALAKKGGRKFEQDRLNLTPIQKKVIMKFFRRLRNVFEAITPRGEHVSKKR